MGDAPKRVWGRDEYEYWVDVPKAAAGRLLLLLLKEKYDGYGFFGPIDSARPEVYQA